MIRKKGNKKLKIGEKERQVQTSCYLSCEVWVFFLFFFSFLFSIVSSAKMPSPLNRAREITCPQHHGFSAGHLRECSRWSSPRLAALRQGTRAWAIPLAGQRGGARARQTSHARGRHCNEEKKKKKANERRNGHKKLGSLLHPEHLTTNSCDFSKWKENCEHNSAKCAVKKALATVVFVSPTSNNITEK